MLQCCNAAMLPWSGWSKPGALRMWVTHSEPGVCALRFICRTKSWCAAVLLLVGNRVLEYAELVCLLQSWVCACRAGEQAKLSHKAGVVCNKTLVDPCPSFVRHQHPEHRRQTTMEHKVLLIKTIVILPGSQCQTWLNLDSTEAQVVLISLFTLGIVEAYFFPQHQFVYYKFPNPTTKVFVGQKLKVGMSVKLNSHFTNPLPSMTLEKAFPSSKTHSSLCPHQLRSVQTLLSLSQNNTKTHSSLCIVWEKTRSKRLSGGRKMGNDLMRGERDLWS